MTAAPEVLIRGRLGVAVEADNQGIVFGPVDAGTARMWLALQADEPDQAVSIGADMHPERHPFPVSRAHYWVHYGRALAQLRGRHDDAVRALRTAESIFPTMVLRDPKVREALATLLPTTRRNALGAELRGLACRYSSSVGDVIDLGGEVEGAVLVDDDLLHERAGPGRFARRGHVDALTPVVGHQGMDEAGGRIGRDPSSAAVPR